MRERVCVWERDTASSYKHILSATQPAMQRGTCFHFFHIAYLVKTERIWLHFLIKMTFELRWRIVPSPQIRNLFKLRGIYNRGCNLCCAFGINSPDGAEVLTLLAPSTRARFLGKVSAPLQAPLLSLRKVPKPGKFPRQHSATRNWFSKSREHTSAFHGRLIGNADSLIFLKNVISLWKKRGVVGIGESRRRERLERKGAAVATGFGTQQGRAPELGKRGKETRLDFHLRAHGSRCFAPQLCPVTRPNWWRGLSIHISLP